MIEFDMLVKSIGMKGIRKIQRMFTITQRVFGGHIKKTNCTKFVKVDGKNYMLLPRFAGFMLKDANLIKEINSVLTPGLDIEIKEKSLNLTKNQKTVMKTLKNVYSLANVNSGRAGVVMQMDPGYGKTYLAMGVINMIKKKTFIIVPNTYLLNQWVDVLTDVFPQNTIGLYYGKKKTDGDIIVSVINSALVYNKYSECGLIIYDEAHMYCSGSFSKIFMRAQAQRVLGITATPDERLDKLDRVAHWSLGNVIRADELDGWDKSAKCFTTKVTCIMYDGHPDYIDTLLSDAGIVSVPLMINQIQEDPYRNELIVRKAIQLYKEGRFIFVFSDRREHLHVLAKLLVKKNVKFEAPEIKKLMGGSTEKDIDAAKDTGRIILTTYQYTAVGVSINKMDTLILATPRKSNMKQIMGRIYRLSGNDKITRHIVDIVDCSTCLGNQYRSRRKTYHALQADLKQESVDWKQFKPA